MNTVLKKKNYLQRKREAILNLGYEYIAYRNRTKKSLRALKRQITLLQS
jgi:hypothetical protein